MKKIIPVAFLLFISSFIMAQPVRLSVENQSEINMKIENNPLIRKWDNEFNAPPFLAIKESFYLPAIEYAIEQDKKEIAQITLNKEKPTFENTIRALDQAGELLEQISAIFFNLYECNNNSEMQQLAPKITAILTDYENEIYQNQQLYSRVLKIYEGKGKKLSESAQLLTKKVYLAFVNHGASLNDAQKNEFNNICQELNKHTIAFSKNVLESTNSYYRLFDNEEELKGLPKSVLVLAANRAKEKNMHGYYFDLSAPSYTAIMKFAENRDVRMKFYRQYNSRGRGDFDNTKTIASIVNLRLQKAKLLGYENYAQLVLQERMAKSPENVYALLDRLMATVLPIAKNELNSLTNFAIKHGFSEEKLQKWDVSFYIEKMKNELYTVNEDELKPYFQLENVIDGVFQLSKDLFHLEYKENTKIDVYHPDVKVYEVYLNDKFMGLLYLDFFPRESKRSGAWMTTFREQYHDMNGTDVRPIVSLVMNFSPSTPDQPSLLTYSELNTFLHEFGHSLHALLSDVDFKSLSCTNVPRDFVEFPSQLMENWASDPAFLKKFAVHYKSGKALDKEMIKNIHEAENFMSAYYFCRQLTYAYSDMAWHTLSEKINTSDISVIEKEAVQKLVLLPEVDDELICTAFSHIFSGGYAAGYYSYKWSEVLSADAFSLFDEKGTYNQKIAESYLKNILSIGSSLDLSTQYKKFRGRNPSETALLKKNGFIK